MTSRLHTGVTAGGKAENGSQAFIGIPTTSASNVYIASALPYPLAWKIFSGCIDYYVKTIYILCFMVMYLLRLSAPRVGVCFSGFRPALPVSSSSCFRYFTDCKSELVTTIVSYCAKSRFHVRDHSGDYKRAGETVNEA